MRRNRKLLSFLLLLSTTFTTLSTSSYAAGETSLGTASSAVELANQVSAAYGGMARIKEMINRGTRSHAKLYNMSSISNASNMFECEFISKGNKLRIEMEVLGQQKVEAFDGKTGWTQAGGWVSKLDQKTVDRVTEEMTHGLNVLEKLDDPNSKLELLPQKKINGKSCDVLKLTPPGGKWTLFYVDPVTRMVLRNEFMGQDSEQGIETLKSVDYFDYRNVMGFPTPYRVVEYLGDRKTQEVLVDAVTIDDAVTENTFSMPEESSYSRLERGPVTIPFEYIGNLIVINARVNNGQEAKFIVDTGASQTVLDKSTAQALGPLTTNTFNVTALAKAVPLSYTKLDKLQIGDLSIENISTLVTDLSSFSSSIGQRPGGLIGANVLSRFLVTFDFQDKKLVLEDPKNVAVPDRAFVIPTSPVFAATGLVVSGQLDDKPINFLVDTGAAFNNLPFSLAQQFNAGSVLTVGQLNGLDGLKTRIGSIKLRELQLGNFKVPNPVFVVRPDKGSSTSPSGLSTASAMGLLGNLVWSKTNLTIDYRNNRIIVIVPVDKQKNESYFAKIEEIDRSYLKKKNVDESAAAFEKLMNNAKADNAKAAEALALSRLASLYADKYYSTKESKWLDLSSQEYERATKLATTSRDKTIEGQILAQWAMLNLNAPRSSTDLTSGQNLLKRASKRAMDPSIFAALGTAMLKTSKSPLAVQFIDNALMLDPSNWQALWTKYKVLESEKKYEEMNLLAAQMSRYYPDFPQVKEVLAKLAKMNPTKKAPGSTSSKPGVNSAAPQKKKTQQR